ncbi:unnamed protein product [Hermetia illucens]|uniref:cyclin-dependent kinase n=1 Tax=Hermetia illucens TaxID=343691 RepID=A0A7R8YWS5_HERIL|nr:unnamed protein product [Hermetia illucens]
MEKYDIINVVGEGSYGLVMRCRHRESGQYVAIKKFLETEDDPTVRKMAIREIRMLKKLRHENLVNLLEVFRRKKRFFLVFEYLEHTVLEELEARAGGLGFVTSRKYIYQILRALDFIHSHDVIHRDVKPENVLVSRLGVIKLCDFGFARPYAENETFTDYVATRWYRSPELLVGDPRYGKEVDIWAVGCLYAEMMTGEPLFPGESDIDQLFQIIRVLGKLNTHHQILIHQNSMFKGMKQEQCTSLMELFPDWNRDSLDFLTQCLVMDGSLRPSTACLLKHDLFTRDDFTENFLPELRSKINQETQMNPLLKRMSDFNSGNKSGDDRSHSKQDSAAKSTSTSKDRSSQYGISLLSLAGNRPSFGSEEQFSHFRHYLNNMQTQQKPQVKQISINNLVFHDANSNKVPRVLSAKPQKTQGEKYQSSNQTQAETPSSPVQFQSLQPEVTSTINHDLAMHGRRLSPTSNLSVGGQYFNQKRSTNILGLHQVAQHKQNKISYPPSIQTSRTNPPKQTRTNLLDVNLLPIGLGPSPEVSKETSPRLFPLHPWTIANPKLTQHSNKTSTTSTTGTSTKKVLTDWKSVARESGNDFLLPNFTGASTSPYKGNRKKLSPMSTLSFQEQMQQRGESIIFPTPVRIKLQ